VRCTLSSGFVVAGGLAIEIAERRLADRIALGTPLSFELRSGDTDGAADAGMRHNVQPGGHLVQPARLARKCLNIHAREEASASLWACALGTDLLELRLRLRLLRLSRQMHRHCEVSIGNAQNMGNFHTSLSIEMTVRRRTPAPRRASLPRRRLFLYATGHPLRDIANSYMNHSFTYFAFSLT
jgi:hypothetical protein